jgi:hypothetical protein
LIDLGIINQLNRSILSQHDHEKKIILACCFLFSGAYVNSKRRQCAKKEGGALLSGK